MEITHCVLWDWRSQTVSDIHPTATNCSPATGCPSCAHDKESRRMRKADIVQRIAEELGCTQALAEAAVEGILTTLKQTFQQRETVILRRFGTFHVRAKPARIGR